MVREHQGIVCKKCECKKHYWLQEKSTHETTKTTLKWVHIAISSLKRNLLGVYHKTKGTYLQNYLKEFCYKLNRRCFGECLFDRVTISLIFCGK